MPEAKKSPKTTKSRKKRFTKAVQGEYLGHIRAGMRPGAAAEYLGLSRDDMLDLIADDAELADLVAKAEAEATELVEEALFQAAISGNVTAAKIWLERSQSTSTALVPVADSAPGANPIAQMNAIAASGGNGGES